MRRTVFHSSWGGSRYLPMAFTEQSVAMLTGTLSSDRAIEVTIAIMRQKIQNPITPIQNSSLPPVAIYLKKLVKISVLLLHKVGKENLCLNKEPFEVISK